MVGGAFKAVRKGHDILGLMIEIHGRVFILDWVVVSKAGRSRKPRWKYAIEMLQEFEHRVKDAGIDPSVFGMATDWWYGQKDALVNEAADMGLTVVSEPAINEIFLVKGQPKTVRQLKEEFCFKSTWGGYPTQRLRAVSKTFGEVILILYQKDNSCTLLMAKAQKANKPNKELRALPVSASTNSVPGLNRVGGGRKVLSRPVRFRCAKVTNPKPATPVGWLPTPSWEHSSTGCDSTGASGVRVWGPFSAGITGWGRPFRCWVAL